MNIFSFSSRVVIATFLFVVIFAATAFAQDEMTLCEMFIAPDRHRSSAEQVLTNQLNKASQDVDSEAMEFSLFVDDTLSRKNVPTSDLVSLILNKMNEFEEKSHEKILENMDELMESEEIDYFTSSSFMDSASSKLTDAVQLASHAVRFAVSSDVEVERSREVTESAASLYEEAAPMLDSMMRTLDSMKRFNNNFPCTCDRCT